MFFRGKILHRLAMSSEECLESDWQTKSLRLTCFWSLHELASAFSLTFFMALNSDTKHL